MSRLEFTTPGNAELVMQDLYKDMERRIKASPANVCPLDMVQAFVNLSHAQSCGKCVPCRVGLGQLSLMIDSVLNRTADKSILKLLKETSLSIIEGADCAIGYRAAEIVFRSLTEYRDDYMEHLEHGRCICSYDQPVPCVSLCPAHVDIPGYIALAGADRYEDAIRLIRKDNPFPSTCGYICEHPCEAKCRRNLLDEPINIRGIKRFAADMAGLVEPPPCAPSTGKRVAIIGGGPCGLSAAYFLQLMGHQCTVFEMLPELGGMLRYGIPNYRLPKDRLDTDIDAILQTGVEIHKNVKIGIDFTFDQLRADYDAVLVTIGASTDKKLGLEHEDAEGVVSAVGFLRDVGLGCPMDLTGQEVAVVGGGNVAMDAVRTARRLGAKKVSIVYRRRVADMTALPDEIEGAAAEGVEIQTLKAPASLVVDEHNHVRGLKVLPQMISLIRDGRASVRASGAPEELIPCDTLIVAIGQNIETEHFARGGMPTKWGNFVANKNASIENLPGVFTGGDCESGPATVIKAIAAAKVIAANIDEYLGYRHTIECNIDIPPAGAYDRKPCGRVNLTEREASERIGDFEGVEIGMSLAEAKQLCSRCLRCDHYGYGAFKGGREFSW